MATFIKIFNLIDNNEIEVVVFDDLHLSNHNQLSYASYGDDEDLQTLPALKFLAEQLKVKVILVSVSQYTVWHDKPTNQCPSIRSFNFSKEMVKIPDHIYYINRPYLNEAMFATVRKAEYHKIEIFSLKNRERLEVVIPYDNIILNVF